ncbi:MAG: hypothetical protein ABI585_00720 [Betaproteobacteria bacterium]
METLAPSASEFVVRLAHTGPDAIARARRAGDLQPLDLEAGIHLLRVEGKADARAGWETVRGTLGDGAEVHPLLHDRDGVAHYPTGEVTVRFATAPNDASLRAFGRKQQVALKRRNAHEPRQAVFEPMASPTEYLPDVADRLAAAPEVERAWLNTRSDYRRA